MVSSVAWPDSESERKKGEQRLAALLIDLARNLNRDVAAGVPSQVVDPRLEELRHIVVGPERSGLERLQQRLDDPEQLTATVSQVLAPAIVQAAARDERLGEALSPMVETATQLSIKKDPRTLVNILYPLIGPAIRKSLSETLEQSMKSLNEMLRQSFSWRGLRWRLEAYRTGTTFAQVVLRHTLVYRVDHVFLIHRHTGLLIEHVTADPLTEKDPQLVSGMLTAIQDFVRDSFSAPSDAGLDTLRFSEWLLWCVESPHAFLVAVIRGNPPQELREWLRDTLIQIHAHKHQALERYEGDRNGFLDIHDLLERCLRVQERPEPAKTSTVFWLLVLVLPLALLVAGGYALYERSQDQRRFAGYVNRLRAEPGIVVTATEMRDNRWHVSGLRDPLAVDPKDLIVDSGLTAERVIGHWAPYQGLDPELVLKRLKASLEVLPSVTLSIEKGAIRARGLAPHYWLEKARAVASVLPPGSPQLDLTSVKDVDKTALEGVRESIESYVIFFDKDAATPTAGQEAQINALAAQLRELASVSRKLRLGARVTVIGHADATGKETTNLALSIARAEVVRSLLKRDGVDPDLLAARGAGRLEPVVSPGEADRNRRVSLTVTFSE